MKSLIISSVRLSGSGHELRKNKFKQVSKKAILLLSLTLVLGACKKKETPTEQLPQGIVAAPPIADCSFFNPLNSMTQQQQVKWLRENQDQACLAQYDQCHEDAHKISETAFQDGITELWGTETVVYSDISLGTIEALSSQSKYGQFVTAEVDGGKNIVLGASNNFTDTPVCYSFPLFYSLQRIHGLTLDSLLTFTTAKIKGKEVIVFRIKGTSDCYDMTSTPM